MNHQAYKIIISTKFYNSFASLRLKLQDELEFATQ